MSEAWINGCEVQRIAFRDGLVISLTDYNEVVVAVPMWLTLPPAGEYPREIVSIDPKTILDEERPLFNFSGSTVTHAEWSDGGDLHIEFGDGHEIDVPYSEHHTAWELYGKYHGYVACLPHGKVKVVRHDLAEESDT